MCSKCSRFAAPVALLSPGLEFALRLWALVVRDLFLRLLPNHADGTAPAQVSKIIVQGRTV